MKFGGDRKLHGHILVIGAGFAGAVYARTLAENGYGVSVIDKRPHIAGNAYDRLENGCYMHVYGPHIFHTNNQTIVDWVKRFSEWVPYKHRVRAILDDGRLVPMPVNLDTIEAFYGRNFQSEAQFFDFLKNKYVLPTQTKNAEEMLVKKIGPELTEVFFKRYTKKMWNVDLSSMDESVVQRVGVRFDRDDFYFQDTFQALPKFGYTSMIENVLNHPNIEVSTGVAFDKGMEQVFEYVFNSMPIDEYYDLQFGALPYRSIRFHHRTLREDRSDGFATLNLTDISPITRETYWHNFPNSRRETDYFVCTMEEPCDYTENNYERYYPVKLSSDNVRIVYDKYRYRSGNDIGSMKFIGRCGTYQYLDMHQVINQSLQGTMNWLKDR